MRAVENDSTYTLSFTREETVEEIKKTIKARELFDKFCYMNWDYGEPAFLFWDRVKSYNLLSEDDAFEYAGVNPCAEEPLPSGGSCLLGSLNLAAFVETINGQPQFNMDEFRKAVVIAVYGLNDVLDEGLPLHPLEVQRDSVRDWRQIGLGIMGLADMLIKLGVTYGSRESLDICDDIGWNLANEALSTSITIAKNKGEYPMFSDKVWESEFYKRHIGISGLLRNSQLLTIAPTGTLSTMLGISGGVEPIFANYYTRRTESLHGEEKEYKIFTPIAWEYLQEHGYEEDETKLPSYFITSAEIPYRNRIDMQATWQRHIDASISSTVNLPNSATIDDVKDLYIYAWKQGLKGITVFRDGCKRLGILTTDNTANDTATNDDDIFATLRRGDIINVDDDLVGYKRKIINGCGDFSEQIFFDDFTGEPLENFIAMGDGGGCARNLEAISRLISLALRSGIPVSEVIKQLKKVHSCPAYRARKIQKGDTSIGTSCPSAIGYAIEELCNKINDRLFDGTDIDDSLIFDDSDHNMMIESWYEDSKSEIEDLTTKPTCPECGEPLVFEGGCNICKACGWSKCD
jgi:ribonucleoside-diphosphate reductase alpha chain